MKKQRIVVLGGGFAGLWSAVGAARKREELGEQGTGIEITLVNRDAYHNIRVRNYEADLADVRVPLDDVLQPIDVARVEGFVDDIDVRSQRVQVTTTGGRTSIEYDRLVFALGSQLIRPNVFGLVEHAFNVDTYEAARKLERHLASLASRPDTPGKWTVLVVGAGLTGLETATEMIARLRTLIASAKVEPPGKVILADHSPHVGSDMGEHARPVIEEALSSLGVATRLGVEVVEIDSQGAILRDGERIQADTVIWCAGMRANPLTASLPVERDHCGRVAVDEYMRVKGLQNIFAAGDVAWLPIDGQHPSVMSCQHGRPMGRFAGHNVVCDLLGLPMLPLQIDWYVTVLDLGEWGALYTEGWDRHVVATGEAAKNTKMEINRRRIYPPLNRNRQDILAAAAPMVQPPPKR
jgi:NADH:ubiquinone reductase (H+-translocating)